MLLKNPFLVLFVLFMVGFGSCTGHRKFQKGEYESAIQRSVNKLRKSPSNRKAAATLNSAYNAGVKTWMEEVYRLESSSDIYKWEGIVIRYQKLNALADEISRCPACLKVVPDPNRYTTALDNALNKAAATRYDLGMAQLNLNSVYAAQEAYRHFVKARSFVSNYKDIEQKMSEAREKGTIRVVMEHIPMHSRSLQISNEFFENKIFEHLSGLNYVFVAFYTPEEAQSRNIKPNHYIQCRFDDFIVGQVYVHEKDQELVRDSVLLETKTLPNKEKQKIYGTVKARLHTFTKTVSSSGLLDLRIVDASSGSILSQNKLPGTFVWETRWGYFNGDQRALNDEQLRYINEREAFPPSPQVLFIEFTKPIFGQVTAALQNFYRRYSL